MSCRASYSKSAVRALRRSTNNDKVDPIDLSDKRSGRIPILDIIIALDDAATDIVLRTIPQAIIQLRVVSCCAARHHRVLCPF